MFFQRHSVVTVLVNNSRTGIPTQIRHKKKARSSWFAVFYGLALTAFLFVALSQTKSAIAEYPLEILICVTVGGGAIYGQLLAMRLNASVHFVSFVFCFLFMSVAPIVQIGAYIDPVFQIDHWALWAAVNALAFTGIGVFMTYRMKRSNNKTQTMPRVAPSNVNYLFAFLLTVSTSGITIAMFGAVLFTSREEFGDAVGNVFPDPSVMTVMRILLFFLPFFGAMIGLRSAIANRQKIWVALFLFAVLMAAIVNNPFINPRYQLAGLAFFAIDYIFYGKKTKLLAVMIIIGVLLAPVFQAFRYASSNTESSYSESSTSPFSQTFLSMDYDAFEVSCYTMLTVNNDGIAWGSNLLGAALFFVPRSLWPGKPAQTSWIIFDSIEHSRNAGTNNLSTPLMAEGYYAFGWVGALIISAFYWWAISSVTLLSRKDFGSWAFLCRSVFTGLALIFLRGTLIVGVGAVVGSLIAAAVPAFLINHRFQGRRLVRVQRPSGAPSDPTLYP
jgi:oligosaccharide repeat unit polymerase